MDVSSVSDGASLVSSIGSAINTVYAARYASEISKYNQSIYNIKASVIEANNKYQKQKFADMRRTYMAKGITTLSAQGVGMGRTSLALLNKSMVNLYVDEAISDYNARMNAISVKSGGAMAGIEGQAQTAAAYSSAASTFAKGAADYGT
jgi:hypothetical protein